jgi:hypothetical protein
MTAASAILLSLWAFSAVGSEATACWPSDLPATCEPPSKSASPPESGAPVVPGPAKAPGEARDPSVLPAGNLDDGLPATWEPLEADDDTLEALKEASQSAFQA